MKFILVVIMGLSIILCSNGCVKAQGTTLAELGVNEEDYCYSTKMGMILYKGIANKGCVCNGSLITTYPDTDEEGNSLIRSDCPPGVMCDSSTVYCKGKITGYKFYYVEESKQFDTLQEWENFCNTAAKNQEYCFDNLNYTKATIDFYENKNTEAIKDYYKNKGK